MSQIGRYEIVRQTGSHGLGSLYQAFDPVMHRPVMIRIADRSTNPGVSFDQARQAILFDAKQLAHLDHPNIIKFLACEEDDGRPYLVMERFEGKPLSGRVASGRLAAILKKAALALDHAHSKGLIHRNLTPDSLLIPGDESDHLKITGFEIARPAQYLNSEAGEDLDLLLDSIHYMSPELVKGDTLDHRSDQYSLGIIAWQSLTGALPFRADSPITLLANIAFEPPDLRGASSSIVKTFEQVFSKNPADRFASASEFAAAFQTAISQPAPIRPGPAPVVLPSRLLPPEGKKSLVPWIIVAVVIVVAVIAGAIFVTRPTPKVDPPQPAAAPQIVPAPPVKVAAPPVKAKAKVAKKIAPAKETTPEAPKLKPIDPKVIHQ
jgi:serine/threonine-protein kinase